jgi:dolichyl-phosphate-mannose--protein O-mannosyl transferase
VVLWPAFALAVGLGLGYGLEHLLKPSWTANFALWAAVSVVVTAATFLAWPALGRLLLAYAYAARIPVAIVAAAAIWQGWGTHYDIPPPGFPVLPQLGRWLWAGLLPQVTIWVAWTVAVGASFGALGDWVASRRRG